MSKIYIGQTDLTIRLSTGKNLSTATIVEIGYQKPNKTRGYFAATIFDEGLGTIDYSIQNTTDINEIGTWIFWAKITNNQGLVSLGAPVKMFVVNEGV